MGRLKLMTVVGTRPDALLILGDTNSCLSAISAKRRTYVTGSPMTEVLTANLDKIRSSGILEKLGFTFDRRAIKNKPLGFHCYTDTKVR